MSILTINNAAKPTLPTQTYCFEARWDCDDSVHNCPDVCGSVTYIDEFGDQQTESGYCTSDGVIQIIASSIVSTIGMDQVTCPTLNTFGVYVGTDVSTVCVATNSSAIKGFTTTTPDAGSIVYNSDSTPYTGSFSYIKIFNYGNISGNDKVFIVTGGTGVLGSERSCSADR